MMPYIVNSPDESLWDEYVKDYAQKHAIHSSHIHVLKPEKDVFTIEMARDVTRLVSTPTASLLIALYHFETARSDTQNALLKTLEESAEHIHIVLFVTESGSLLPTVMSRCVAISLGESSRTYDESLVRKYGLMPNEASYVDYLQASKLISKDEVITLLQALLYLYRQKYLSEPTRAHASVVRLLQTSIWQHTVTHVNPEYLLDYIAGALEKYSLLKTTSN